LLKKNAVKSDSTNKHNAFLFKKSVLDIEKIPLDQQQQVLTDLRNQGYFDEEDTETQEGLSWFATQWQDLKNFVNPFNK